MVYMYHSFLIHSSADGHLGCFHVLAMISSAAMNMGVHVSLSDLVSLVCMPRSGHDFNVSVLVFYCCSDNTSSYRLSRASLVAQSVKTLLAIRENWFDPWVGKIPWRRKWQPTSVSSMDRGAWRATVHGIVRVLQDLVTKPPLLPWA